MKEKFNTAFYKIIIYLVFASETVLQLNCSETKQKPYKICVRTQKSLGESVFNYMSLKPGSTSLTLDAVFILKPTGKDPMLYLHSDEKLPTIPPSKGIILHYTETISKSPPIPWNRFSGGDALYREGS